MKLLPKAFQMEVTLEMYGKHLVCHPLFNALGERGSTCLGDICSACLNEVILDTKEALFSPGDQAHSMYILTHGLLGYLVVLQNPNYPVAKTGKVEHRNIQEQECFGEAVMWTPWVFQGSMVAKSASAAMAICSKKFRERMRNH